MMFHNQSQAHASLLVLVENGTRRIERVHPMEARSIPCCSLVDGARPRTGASFLPAFFLRVGRASYRYGLGLFKWFFVISTIEHMGRSMLEDKQWEQLEHFGPVPIIICPEGTGRERSGGLDNNLE